VSEKVTNWALVVALFVVVICVADVALPDIGPVNDAVPPFAVFVNKMRCVVADVELLIVTPELIPAGPLGTTSDRIGAAGLVTSIVAEHVG
jgi:hypothetical protein